MNLLFGSKIKQYSKINYYSHLIKSKQLEPMTKRISSALSLLTIVLFLSPVLSQTCNDPNYIIPVTTLDAIFDGSYGALRSPQTLIAFLGNPTAQNLQQELVTLIPASAPLWGLAVAMFVLFFVCLIQVCCFSVCRRDGCGNQIHSETYMVGPIRCLIYTFIFCTLVIIALTILAFVVNSGLIAAASFTSCNSQLIANQFFQGNTATTNPWSGLINFSAFVTNATTNLQNVAPFLQVYFSSSNADFTSVATNSTTSTYGASQMFNCQKSTVTLQCPFPFNVRCPSPLQAVFNEQYCNASFTGSANNLISNEMQQNSTVWFSSINGLSTSFSTLNTSAQAINSSETQVINFQDSVEVYQTQLVSQYNTVEQIIYAAQIVLYVFYSFLLIGAIASLVMISATYFALKFNCRIGAHIFWIFYFVIGTIIFIASGFLIGASVFSFDVCTAYGFYFTNQTNFNQISFADDSVGQIFETCYFTKNNSIFDAFSDPLRTQLDQIDALYIASLPNSLYSSAAMTVETNLLNYALYPQTITFVGQNSTSSVTFAVQQVNQFANFSAEGSTQSCNITRDFFAFNPTNCTPYIIGQTPPSNSCVVVNQNNFSSVITARVASFDAKASCSDQGDTYENNADALRVYSVSAFQMVDQLMDIRNSSGSALQNYERSYFNYYSEVMNFMNDPVRQAFLSFLTPYRQLSNGASCGFVKTSFDALVDVACNQMFPYINAFAIVNIVLAAFTFIVMSVLYFLAPRLNFFMFLEGNFQNYGEKTYKTEEINDTELANRNQDFLTSTDRRDV